MKKLRAKLALVCLMLAITVGIASVAPAYACGPQGGTDSSKGAPKMPPDVAAQIAAAILAAMSVL